MCPRCLADQFPAPVADVTPEHRVTVFRHPHDVIFAVSNRVAAAFVRFHSTILHGKLTYPTLPKGVGFTDPLSETLGRRFIRTIWRLRGCVRLAGMFSGIAPCAGRGAAGLRCGWTCARRCFRFCRVRCRIGVVSCGSCAAAGLGLGFHKPIAQVVGIVAAITVAPLRTYGSRYWRA